LRLLFAIGNETIEKKLKNDTSGYEAVDFLTTLGDLYDMLNYTEVNGIVFNALLDDNNFNYSIKLAKRTAEKGIKVIVLIGDIDYEQQKSISLLVNCGVTAFLKLNEVSGTKIFDIFSDYPKEFDFNILVENTVESKTNFPKIVVKREIIKSVFKEVIAVYSPTSEGSTTVATHLAVALATSKNCRVCLADLNLLKPRIKGIFNASTDNTLSDALNCVIKDSLTHDTLESLTWQSKYKNLNILFGLYDFNDYYANIGKVEYYEEIIEKLKFIFDYVIIDTNSFHDIEGTHAALVKADKVIVPVKGCRYSINEMQRYLDMFSNYNDFDLRRFSAVINKYGDKDLTSFEIAALVKYPITGYIRRNTGYEDSNCFGSNKILNQYITVLKAIGIDVKKKWVISDLIKGIKKVGEKSGS
jgi:cellulose biosynthesis protein BcsQ